MYKVYPDGREELVRGAEIARIDLKAFKRILAAGDTPYVYNTPQEGNVRRPALLLRETRLAKVDRDYDNRRSFRPLVQGPRGHARPYNAAWAHAKDGATWCSRSWCCAEGELLAAFRGGTPRLCSGPLPRKRWQAPLADS